MRPAGSRAPARGNPGANTMTSPGPGQSVFARQCQRLMAGWRRVSALIGWLVGAVAPTPEDLTEAGVCLGEMRD